MFIPVWYWSDISNKVMGRGAFHDYRKLVGFKRRNEIDIVAVNRIDRTARIAEVKINRNKISMPVLKENPKTYRRVKRYQIEYTGYSLEDM